jgi:hypothetical protein
MDIPKVTFEVEIRCHFDSQDQAFELLSFLRTCLQGRTPVPWVTRFFGLPLFKSGQLLRVAEVAQAGQAHRYLGWKGPDLGRFANIRQEIDEEFTTGIVNSTVLRQLGGTERYLTANGVVEELERIGHVQFMAFQGKDLTGYDPERDLKVKLMTCPVLKWPVIVELEKTADTEQAARRLEDDLRELSNRFALVNRLVRKEPPTLLYEQLYSQ